MDAPPVRTNLVAVQHRLDDAAEERRRALLAQGLGALADDVAERAAAAQLLDDEDLALRLALVHVLRVHY